MSAVVRDAIVLARLRWILLLRSSLTRYTRAARRAAPLRSLVTVAIALWVLGTLVLPVSLFLTSTLEGPAGRATLETWLETGGSALTVVIFFYGLLSLVGTLTYRSDLSLLLLTPVSPRLIMGTKILGASLGFSTLLLAVVPGLIGADRQLHLGPFFVASTLLVVVILPLAPISLATLFVLAIVRVVPAARARSLTTMAGTIVGGGLFLAQQALIRHQSPTGPNAAPPRIPDAVPSAWAGHGLAAVGLGDRAAAALFGGAALALSLMVFVVATEVSARFFETGAAVFDEVHRRRRVLAKSSRSRGPGCQAVPVVEPHAESARRSARAPEWWPLMRKEWLLLRRDPQRLSALVYPLLIIGFYLWQLVSAHATTVRGGFLYGTLYGVLILASVLLVNSLAPTVVNREGRSLYLLALAPLTPRDILWSKWAITAGPVVALIELLLVVTSAALGSSPDRALVIGVIMAGVVVALTALSIAINLLWPKFDSTNPRRQSSRVASLLSIVCEFVVGAVVFGGITLMVSLWPDSPVGAAAVLLLLVTALGGVIVWAAGLGTKALNRLLQGDRATGS